MEPTCAILSGTLSHARTGSNFRAFDASSAALFNPHSLGLRYLFGRSTILFIQFLVDQQITKVRLRRATTGSFNVYDNLFLKKIFIYDNDIYKARGIIIKQTAIKTLDENELEFIEALRNLNVPRNVATLITYLANANEATSREIEVGTNLRQPEVSIAMRALRQNNWVDERDIKTEVKGRPMTVYKLGVPIEKIIQYYEDEIDRASAHAMESIQRLKELTTA